MTEHGAGPDDRPAPLARLRTGRLRTGRLDIVATPIGNLGDLSPRAREALAGADLIAAEDTRRTGLLLSSFGIKRPLRSLHAHNERERAGALIDLMQAGQTVALVSDAGTPLLSDPGAELVRLAIAADIEVRAIPGATALATALAVSGLGGSRFCFEGFIEAKPAQRRRQLADLAGEARTMVFFEAPHRIAESLQVCVQSFGAERPGCVARELTKVFESVYRGSLQQLAERAASDPDLRRGEITLVIGGAPAAASNDAAAAQRLATTLAVLLEALPPSRAAAVAARLTGARRSDAYQAALRLAGRNEA